MASRIGSSFSCLASTLPSPSGGSRISQLSFSQGLYGNWKNAAQQLKYINVKSRQLWEGSRKWKHGLFVVCEDQSEDIEINSDDLEQEDHHLDSEDISPASISSSFVHLSGTGGKPGLISFYNRPYKKDGEILISNPERSQNNLLWFIGPAVLVASFIFPSLYLRRILSAIFEDSLLTDFLILFFTEALFYCGVAVFLLLIDRLRRPIQLDSAVNSSRNLSPQLGQKISYVAALVLSLIIPMVTMGLVWPWTGPAASATLAPYLVGMVVQFAFEQYARYQKSPSWPAIPIIFQVYRLHQLNRAAQLVTALSFTVRGAEMTAQNIAINSSLGTLLNVLQFLGIICIWSLSSFLMRFVPSAATTME
ncbi:Transmembrane protein [Quillaja saponaria]|uniref:Transmembrane protein n=1 Tax=Quillaja saponaria TaxID=32244 RepID=A0AAD7KU29_QUISA|nr:Transmembrane protein [Quillaja saponaria]